jgi:hypothetical protein
MHPDPRIHLAVSAFRNRVIGAAAGCRLRSIRSSTTRIEVAMRIVVDLNRCLGYAQYNEHVGWGRGIHVCFRGPLARLEVNTAFDAFLQRVEDPRLVEDPPPYRISQVFRGPRHLLVDYDEISPDRS